MDGINRKKIRDVLVVPGNTMLELYNAPPKKSPAGNSNDNSVPSYSGAREGVRNTVPNESFRNSSPRVDVNENPFFVKVRTPNSLPAVPQRRPYFWLWFILVILFLGAGFVVLSYFSSATIEIVQQSQAAAISQEFTASKKATGDSLSFEFMSLTEDKTREITATTEKKIDKKASGKVIIYNAYGAESQRLIKNTRLESPGNKIFRINESVVVPGAKISGGKVITPGSVEVMVYADAPGKDYNIGVSNFTIPGFKGDPRFGKFSASSMPDSPMSGGFTGTVKVPSDQDVIDARKSLREELKGVVIQKARAQVPAGVLFFPGSIVLKFEDVPQDLTLDTAAKITVRAIVSVFFFDTVNLTKKIASATIKDYKGELVHLQNPQAMTFTFLDSVDGVVLSDIDQVRFSIKGDGLFLWDINIDKIVADAVGRDKKDLSKIIEQAYVKKVEATVRPIWSTKFPSDPAKIIVKIVN